MAGGILERLRSDLTDYKPIVLWKWNGELEADMLAMQLDDIKASGAGGAVICAGMGLETAYLGEEWFQCVTAALARADALRLRLWAGFKLDSPAILKEKANRALFLTSRREDAFDPKALACYRVENENIYRLTDDDGSPCECVYLEESDNRPDLMNWKVVRALIEEGCESYYRRYARFFGNLLSGFYVQPEALLQNVVLYSHALDIKFKQKYGEDILSELGALFLPCAQSERFRYQYFTVLNELYSEAFASQLSRWCTEHNCRLTGAWAGQKGLLQQMLLGEGELPTAEFEHVPAVRRCDEISVKQVSSASAQLGKRQVLLDLEPGEQAIGDLRALRRAAEVSLAYGANLICLNGYPYTRRGGRKRSGQAVYAPEGASNGLLKQYNRYFTYLGYMLSNSREVVDTLVIHPMHSAYLRFNADDASAVDALDAALAETTQELDRRGILHHYGNEVLMRKYASIKNGKLCIGKCFYSKVVVPDIDLLEESTVDLLCEFVKAGGKLCLTGAQKLSFSGSAQKVVTLASNTTLDELGNPGFGIRGRTERIRFSVRRSDFGDYIVAANTSDTETCQTSFHINAKSARKFNLEKPGFEPLLFSRQEKGIDIPLTLEAGEIQIIFLSSAAESAAETPEKSARLISKPEAIIECADDNVLPLDRAQVSFDGEVFTEAMEIGKIRSMLIERAENRTVYLRFRFQVNAKPASIALESEYANGARLTFNDIELIDGTEGKLGEGFTAYDLSGKLKTGENVLLVRLDYYQSEDVYACYSGKDKGTELKNPAPETEIESLYLRGAFCLEGGIVPGGEALRSEGEFSLTLPRRYVNLSRLAFDGYPFFSGAMTLRTVLHANGGETDLKFNGRFYALRISVNGGEEKLLTIGNAIKLPEGLRKGDHTLRLTLYSDIGLLPRERELAGDGYKLKLFGIDSIELN